jgi:hypothetical protein
MKSKLLWAIVALALLGCILYWRQASRNRLDIDPHARKEIERAKQR